MTNFKKSVDAVTFIYEGKRYVCRHDPLDFTFEDARYFKFTIPLVVYQNKNLLGIQFGPVNPVE